MEFSHPHHEFDLFDVVVGSHEVVEEERRKRSQKLSFGTKMIQEGLSAEKIGRELVLKDWKLDEVVELHDSLITKTYLEYCSEEDVKYNSGFNDDNLLDFDLQHIRVLFDNGPNRDCRKEDFVGCLFDNICNYEKTQRGRDFLQTIADQRLFDEVCFDHLESSLMWNPERIVKIILKYGFHRIAKDMYDRDITCNLFANGCENVLSLLAGNDAIDVNKRYANGNTPLHIAAKHGVRENIQWLLDRGADPNARNNEQHTPLSLALKNDNYEPHACIEALLLAGGNLVSVSHLFEDATFFGFRPEELRNEDSWHWQILELLIAQLCIHEAADADDSLSIERLIGISFGPRNRRLRRFIEILSTRRNRKLGRFLDKCRQQLKTLKKHEVCDSRHRETHRTKVTMFSVLAEKPELVARYISEEQLQTIEKFMATYNADTLYTYYRQLLKRRFKEIAFTCRGRNRAVEIVCQLTGIHDTNHLVVHKIVNYLNTRDFIHFFDNDEQNYTERKIVDSRYLFKRNLLE